MTLRRGTDDNGRTDDRGLWEGGSRPGRALKRTMDCPLGVDRPSHNPLFLLRLRTKRTMDRILPGLPGMRALRGRAAHPCPLDVRPSVSLVSLLFRDLILFLKVTGGGRGTSARASIVGGAA